MAGTDLEVEGAKIVGLRIEMEICVDPEHFQGDVYDALLEVFVTGNRAAGRADCSTPATSALARPSIPAR